MEMNNKLECLSLTSRLGVVNLLLYSQSHIKTINFLCNLLIRTEARVFVHGKTVEPSVMQHSSLVGPFISYNVSYVLLQIQSLG
jgi:hypothetical protein